MQIDEEQKKKKEREIFSTQKKGKRLKKLFLLFPWFIMKLMY